MIHDVIVVGAGPGGAAAASFMARRGMDVLLLDRSDFPREKVCGDGLTPQAIAWADRLGCAAEVLAATKGCIKSCDLYINGRKTLTGGFPDGTQYPDFAVLLDRRRFDHIILRNALEHGAKFQPRAVVREVVRDAHSVRVAARVAGRTTEFRSRIVVGADGVTSVVSRAIGNVLKAGVMAVSVRGYYTGVRRAGAPIKVYFDRAYFPGYGWLFVDEDGFANVGLGYAVDSKFSPPDGLVPAFQRFLARELAEPLADAKRCGATSGGSSAFYRPGRIAADRAMLVGDAANQADPLNGGGIHKAMESGYLAAETAAASFASGDFSARSLARYTAGWARQIGGDWQTAEMFLTIAKNPALRDFCLLVLEQIGRLTVEDGRFRDFCAGVFSGVLAQDLCLSPALLYHAFPKDLSAWRAFLAAQGGIGRGAAQLARRTASSLATAGGAAAREPLANVDWGMEVAAKAMRLAERRVSALGGLSRH
ncbi:MAG: NAD(P)/FAD-dependent oxidoreductase [Acetobacteraceae bacterium]